MKKIIFILIAICFFSSNTYADHKGWPHGKKWAYNCAKTTECNIIIENINKQPKLFIGKSVYSGNNKAINIADKGKPIKPNKMVGIWGEDWKSSPTNDSNKILWDDFYDSMIYAPAIDDGNEIFLNEQFKNEVMDGGVVRPFRHSLSISHLLQSGKLEKLKEGLINGAKGKWLKELQSDPFLYQSGEYVDFQAYGNSLNWFYPTIIPLLEAHIVLQRNNMYTEEEFKIVHSWLEKRVWVLEQGPLDGLVSSAFDWNNFFEAANHESINKKVAYMLWGVADQNEIYFTAALNGFEDFYKSMRKKNGTFKNEHKKGDGANYGLQSGNFVGQSMIVMAVILQHQGIDVRKKYKKIEKFIKWASKSYKDPEELGYGGGNNDLRFLSNDPLKLNTVGWMYLWDKAFGTNYTESNNFPSEARTMTVYGIADASGLLNPSSHAEEIVKLPKDSVLSKSLDSSATTDGRWRGLAICDWDKEKWGGGEYELGNGKISGVIDFTISKGIMKATNRNYPGKGRFWFDWSGGGHKIQSFKISKKKIIFDDTTNGKYPTIWEGNLITNNTMDLSDEWDSCNAKLFRTEEIAFDSYSPKNILDYVDGVENDKKYTIPGLLTFPEGNEEKYPVMMMIVNSGCGYGHREFTYGVDIKNQGVATLEIDNCTPRGLNEDNPIARGNWLKLTPWMGTADALYALKFLQSHPKVEGDKIGITGFSWGGQVAYFSGLDLIRKSIVGDDVDFALRVPYYFFCRQFDDPKYSKNKLHIIQGELDSVPPNHCIEMTNSFNNLGYDVSIDVYPGAYHNFDDPWWDSPPPKKNYYQWYVTDKCYYWIDSDYKRSWRLDDMKIEFDNYIGWDFSSDPFYKEYKKECEHSGPMYGRNDSAAQQSATKLVELINQYLK